jgi:hypothetical protein
MAASDTVPIDEPGLRQALDRETKRLIEDCLYTGRGHQSAGQFWRAMNTWLGLPTAIASPLLATGAAGSALAQLSPWVTAGLAVLSAIAGAAHGFFRPYEISEAHGLKGNRIISLRNDARLFLEIELRSDRAPEELSARLRDLRQRYADLNETAPLNVPRFAYLRAKRNIEAGESTYAEDSAERR